MTQIELDEVLQKEPKLTALGIETRFTGNTDRLPDLAEIQKCVDWLKSRKLIPTKTATFNSIRIKQHIEQEMKTYVTSGAVVAAIINLGIPYNKVLGSPYVEVFLNQNEIFGKRKRYDRFGQEIKAA